MKAPHTYFSTEFQGGPGAIRSRLTNLFSAGRRRGTSLAVCALLAAVLAGALVACDTSSPPGPDADPAIPQDVLDYALDQAGELGTFTPISLVSTYEHVLDQGILEIYQTSFGTKDYDPETTPLAGGMNIDGEGYLFSGWQDLLLFRAENGSRTPLAHTVNIDGSVEETGAGALLGFPDTALQSAGERLLARYYLARADEAMGYLTGAAPTEGTPYTDESGRTWHKLAGFEKWDPDLRVDDQVFSILISVFGRDKAAELMQRYVYVPESVFLEQDGGLWVRSDAADLMDWHCTGDVSTLAVTGRDGVQLTFTLEGTDAGQPCTWDFAVRWQRESGGFQFTQYYKLSAPLYTPTPASGVPEPILAAVQAEMDRRSAALESENAGAEIVDSEITELDIIRSLSGIIDGATLEVWSFDYRLKPSDHHGIVMAGSMGLDEEGWLVELYSMGAPCVIAARTENGGYMILGTAFDADFGASSIHERAVRVIVDGCAQNGLALLHDDSIETWEF